MPPSRELNEQRDPDPPRENDHETREQQVREEHGRTALVLDQRPDARDPERHINAAMIATGSPRSSKSCTMPGLSTAPTRGFSENLMSEHLESLIRAFLGDSAAVRYGDGRIRGNWWPVVQTAVAASAAWYLAGPILGHEKPFVAPIAAVIALGGTVGREERRAVEWIFGVALGLVSRICRCSR